MPGNASYRVSFTQRPGQLIKRFILCVGERHGIAALELDADGKIVAAGSPLPERLSGMPGTLDAGNELDDPPVTAHKEMCRYFKPGKGLIIGMRIFIQSIGE